MDFHFSADDVSKLSKEQLIQLLMIQQQINNNNTSQTRPVPKPRTRKPVPKPRTKLGEKPIPAPRETSAFPINWEKVSRFDLLTSAFKKYDRSYSMDYPYESIIDPYEFIRKIGSRSLTRLIQDNFNTYGSIKMFCTAHIEFIKRVGDIEIIQSPHLTVKRKLFTIIMRLNQLSVRLLKNL